MKPHFRSFLSPLFSFIFFFIKANSSSPLILINRRKLHFRSISWSFFFVFLYLCKFTIFSIYSNWQAKITFWVLSFALFFNIRLNLSQDNNRNDVVHAYFEHFGKWQLVWRSMRLTKKHLKNNIQVLVKDLVWETVLVKPRKCGMFCKLKKKMPPAPFSTSLEFNQHSAGWILPPLWDRPSQCSGQILHYCTGSRGDVFVVRTSKPVETLWKMGYFDRVTVSLHILYTANQEIEGSQDRLRVLFLARHALRATCRAPARIWLVVITSAEREVKDSRRSGMLPFFWRFLVLFGYLTKWEPN